MSPSLERDIVLAHEANEVSTSLPELIVGQLLVSILINSTK